MDAGIALNHKIYILSDDNFYRYIPAHFRFNNCLLGSTCFSDNGIAVQINLPCAPESHVEAPAPPSISTYIIA